MFNFNRHNADDHFEPRGVIERHDGGDEASASKRPFKKPAANVRKSIAHGLPGLEEAARNSLASRAHHPFERQGR